MLQRLKLFLTFRDSRWEDINRENYKKVAYRDFSAGLIVAMTAIPMAMGFAIASGLRPEQGIIAGAVACAVGRTWGGSKYQVYGPTAAFIPILYALMQKYDHGFLILTSIIAGIVLIGMGMAGLGRIVQLVPNSIVVGFTVGIGIAIAATNLYDVLGINADVGSSLVDKFTGLFTYADQISLGAMVIGLSVFAITKGLLRVSIFIPGPLLALGFGTLLSATIWRDAGLTLIQDKFGAIPTNFFDFTAPTVPQFTPEVLFDLGYFVVAIVFISSLESLLCSTMADRLAGNRGTKFNPDKEFFGQGMVQIITPLINGFPCTGALARTSTSIKAGAVTPLAGYFKFATKLLMAYYLATWLNLVPMACIGGILLWVASNMINIKEVRKVLATGRFHSALMLYTAAMVPLTDFLTGVLSALVIYLIARRFLEPAVIEETVEEPELVEAA